MIERQRLRRKAAALKAARGDLVFLTAGHRPVQVVMSGDAELLAVRWADGKVQEFPRRKVAALAERRRRERGTIAELKRETAAARAAAQESLDRRRPRSPRSATTRLERLRAITRAEVLRAEAEGAARGVPS